MKTLLECARAGRALTGLDIVDMHGHLGAYAFPIPDRSAAGMVALMDRLGVAQVMCSHMRCMSGEVRRGNREVSDAMRAFPGRLLGYAAVWPSSARAVQAELKACLALGFSGIKLHNANGFSYQDDAYAPAYALAEARRLPVLFHTWGSPKELDETLEIARRHPNASFLLAHSGATNEQDYIRVARAADNLYLETCFSQAPRGLIQRLVEQVGAEKVVWGSDGYFYSQAQQFGRVLGARIADEDKIRILATNAHAILGRIRM